MDQLEFRWVQDTTLALLAALLLIAGVIFLHRHNAQR
jgi:hypothetical protein